MQSNSPPRKMCCIVKHWSIIAKIRWDMPRLKQTGINNDPRLSYIYQMIQFMNYIAEYSDGKSIYKQITISLLITGMESTDIVRKRLNDLKKLSQNLKQSTQITNEPDINLIKAIINITKTIPKVDSNPNLNQSAYNLSTKQSHNQSNQMIARQPKLSKNVSISILNNHLAKTHSMNDILLNDQLTQPLFPETNNANFKKQSTPNKYNPPRSPSNHNLNQQQLIHLRQQNVNLELQLKDMKEKLNAYKLKQQEANQKTVAEQRQKQKQRQKQMRDEQDDWTNNTAPYFKLNEEVMLFLTKITIQKKDYQKVQYQYHPLKLTLDRIITQKLIRKSSIKQSKGRKYSSASSQPSGHVATKQQFNLSHLIQVQYIQNDKILLIFGNQNDVDTKTRLFLQFDDQETMHRWDLAIYINFKIVNNLNGQKLFMAEKNTRKIEKEPESNRSSVIFGLDDVVSQNPTEEKLALKRYLEDKKKFIESQKLLKQIMLHKIMDLKSKDKQKNSILADSLIFSKKQNENESEKEKEKQKEKDAAFSYTQQLKKRQSNNIQISVTIGSPNKEAQQVQVGDNPENSTKPQTKQILQNMYQKRKPQPLNIQQPEYKIKLQQEQEQRKALSKKRVEDAIKLLKNGMFMTKYARSAFNPHEKRVFISQDYAKFCWQDKDSSSFKFIPISQIQSICRGQIGKGVEKHVGRKKIKNLGCFILINTSSTGRKTLQFGMKSLKLMEQFSQSLHIFLSELKQGHLGDQQ